MAVVWTGGKCFGLGVLAALGWLAVNFLDLLRFGTDLPPFLLLPFWARLAVRIVLVLALPTLILLLDRQARAWLGLHPAFALVGLSAVLVAALPALFALAAPQEVFALPLLVPTMCLGMALGLTDGMRHLRR